MDKAKQQNTGEVVSLRGLIAKVVFFADDKPKVKELLTLEKDVEAYLEVQKYEDSNTAFCTILKGEKHVRKRDKVERTGTTVSVPVGEGVLGRMFNALGQPIDEGEPVKTPKYKSIYDLPDPTDDIHYDQDHEIIETGVKVIDFLTPFVKGSRIGIAGGAGVGKTVLINSIIKSVAGKKIALPMFTGIGERIHEGQEMHENLKEAGLLKEAVLFMGQMNESASIRTLVGQTSAALAQYFRDEEKRNVLYFVDNIYRFAQAGNELSTMMSEIPSEGSYQSTIFSDIRRFQERLYSNQNGSITAIQTIYIPADDVTDPAVREIQQQLDSVIVLSRKKAESNLYPAVDLLATRSSMVTPQIVGNRHYNLAVEVQSIMQRYESLRTIVSIIGEHELSQEDQLKYKKAKVIIQYFVQMLKGEDVKYYSKEETLDGLEEIVYAQDLKKLT